MKDKKKIHGAVDKSSLQLHFCKSDAIIFVKSKAIATPSASGPYGRQVVRQNTEFFKFLHVQVFFPEQ